MGILFGIAKEASVVRARFFLSFTEIFLGG
jgi:hypothetical protein